jgi:hypothetical protein
LRSESEVIAVLGSSKDINLDASPIAEAINFLTDPATPALPTPAPEFEPVLDESKLNDRFGLAFQTHMIIISKKIFLVV